MQTQRPGLSMSFPHSSRTFPHVPAFPTHQASDNHFATIARFLKDLAGIGCMDSIQREIKGSCLRINSSFKLVQSQRGDKSAGNRCVSKSPRDTCLLQPPNDLPQTSLGVHSWASCALAIKGISRESV